MMNPRRKPRMGVFKFASCDGCQLSLLDAEDELLSVCELVEIAHFAEASSNLAPGPYDVALIEGSITTEEDGKRIVEIRSNSRYLIAIGACATSGGIQALRQWGQLDDWVRYVYPSPEYIKTLQTSTPISAHVLVDFELHGCPINHHQLVEVLVGLAEGRRPRLAAHSVCLDCKLNETVCKIVATGTACLGPITQSGCGAICPSFHRGCYGCYGPSKPAQTVPLITRFQSLGHSAESLTPLLQSFNAAAPEFQQAASQVSHSSSDKGGPA